MLAWPATASSCQSMCQFLKTRKKSLGPPTAGPQAWTCPRYLTKPRHRSHDPSLPLQVLNARLECLLITRLVGRTFSGRLVLKNAKEERSSTDASMDDLVLLALDSGAPLLVHKDVSR